MLIKHPYNTELNLFWFFFSCLAQLRSTIHLRLSVTSFHLHTLIMYVVAC